MVHPDDAPAPGASRQGPRRNRLLSAGAAAAALVLASAALITGLDDDPVPGAAAPTPAGSVAPASPGPTESAAGRSADPGAGPEADPETEPPAAPEDSGLPAAAAPTWLTVGAARIDQPVLALTPTEGDLAAQSIVPPLTEDAYWLTNYGQPGDGSQNTTYITGHSWDGADAPFDRLSTDVAVGDTIVLGTATGAIDYVVESVTTHDKNTLKNSDIWNIVPNRLVLISCFTQDIWGKNVVITAVPATSA